MGDPSEVAEIAAGSTDKSLTVTLQAGHYVIFCNLHVEDLLHYQKGMHVDLIKLYGSMELAPLVGGAIGWVFYRVFERELS